MDRGIWATWYDVPPEARSDHLNWLHGSYLPEMLKRPGYLWAAHIQNNNSEERKQFQRKRYIYDEDAETGTGNDFLLIYGGDTAHTFLHPSPEVLFDSASLEDQHMLRQRLRSRTAILAEIDRVEGPEIAARDGMTVGPVVQMGTFMPHSVEAEAELCSWYVWHRLPLIREMPGCIGARRLVSVVGRYKQSILYDFTRVNDLDGHFSDPHPDSRRMLAQISHAPNSPTLGTRVWPPVSAS